GRRLTWSRRNEAFCGVMRESWAGASVHHSKRHEAYVQPGPGSHWRDIQLFRQIFEAVIASRRIVDIEMEFWYYGT
ncbi:MAG: hypothetical protein KAV87_28655, partial [Desulfobacteraceae bacterium]|nr:hypothetical protein [Desulfobacteraceae bacterium]